MNKLEEICRYKKNEIEENKKKKSIDFFLRNKTIKTRNFLKNLINNKDDKFNLIAEIKRSSPSRGIIRKDFNLENIAIDYEKAGAMCLSVLTEKKFFEGEIEFIKRVKENVKIPILRKDFIIDPWQVYESFYYGADCILLILAILDDKKAYELYKITKNLGLSVIAEVHNQNELKRAIDLNFECIGVNNRNLKTLKIDLNTFIKLSKNIPKNIIKICESGISRNEQLIKMEKNGANAFLIGESLMQQKDIYNATDQLIKRV